MIKQLFRALSGKCFPRNPKDKGLSHEKLRALSIGAILAATRVEYWDSLETSSTSNAAKSLREWWGIDSTEMAEEALNRLKNKKSSRMYNAVLMNASETWGREQSFEDFTKAYKQAGVSLIDEDIVNEHERETGLVMSNIDELFNIPGDISDDEVNRTLERMFGDADTIGLCVQIYRTVLDECANYVRCADDLRQTFDELQKRGIVGSQKDLEGIDTLAWDMGRMVNVARWCCELGYITMERAWECIFHAEKESAARYADWTAFGKSYVVGRAMWGGPGMQLTNTIDIVEKLHKDEESPWKQLKLHQN